MSNTSIRTLELNGQISRGIANNTHSSVTDAMALLESQIKPYLSQLYNLIENGRTCINYDGDIIFKETYAHHACYVLLDGFEYMFRLDSRFECNNLVIHDAQGAPAHYLVKLMVLGHELYMDAYGIYDDLEKIKQRYKNCILLETIQFDEDNSECKHFQQYRDQSMELIDMVEGELEAQGKSTDMTHVMDTLDYYQTMLAFTVLRNCIDHDIANLFI
ncbi:hypothetical protein [Vibrio sp. 1180_3]|uniref:hypothetical protein n=1 Tax=Vibrio sp. 1180_3 TaxID=2528832 RepID=UPI002405C4C1|nr:hypothetical protein [Vibrio sp. 1180_3]MDF9399080.1 hypothetical protein [Vibrio sp. 1180_3]